MKLLSRIGLLVVALILALPMQAVSAQDEAEAMDPFEGVYIQAANFGSLEASEGDTYTLTLEGIGEDTAWMIHTPELRAGNYPTLDLLLDWAAAEQAEDITLAPVQGALEIGDVALTLQLSNPIFDSATGIATYTVTIENQFSFEENAKSELPDLFENATLFITFDTAFQEALIAGFDIRAADFRARGGRSPRSPSCCGSSTDTKSDDDADEDTDENNNGSNSSSNSN